MVEGLEKRRGIRPGTKVLATRGPPSAGRVGNEAQNQAWDSGFGNTRAAKFWKGWKRGAESGLGLRFWQHEEVTAWSVCIFQDPLCAPPRRTRLPRALLL